MMTTIAYKDGVMACDSCWASNSVQTTSLTKIQRLSSSALIGTAGDGDVRAVLALLDKIKSPDKLPTRFDLAATRCDFDAILVFLTGQVWHISIGRVGKGDYEGQVWPANRGIAAVGSGSELAIGAMAAGKSARDAVNIACKFDINSRRPVHVVALAERKKQ